MADIAVKECAGPGGIAAYSARREYQWGHALIGRGDYPAARSRLEAALARGYRAAGIDLGILLTGESYGMPDPARAVSLYQNAWDEGVQIAAYRLGDLYESGGEP